MKKALCLFFALLMTVSMFVSCADDGGKTEQSTSPVISNDTPDETQDPYHDAEGYLLDSLPELDFGNEEIGFLYDTKYSYIEFFAEETNGEPVNDAIYARNLAVEDRLKVKLVFTGETGNHDNQKVFLAKAQADINADCDFTIYGAYSRTVPLLAFNGLCTNLRESEYIDLDKPWWPKALVNECTIHDKLFFCTGDISTNTLWMMSCVFYNQTLMEEQHLEDIPEKIVFDGKWTLDRFCDIIKSAYVEGSDESSTVYGLAVLDTCVDAFLNANGVISIVKDGNGDLMLSDDFVGERTLSIVEKLGNLFSSSKAAHHTDSTSGEQKIFYDGRALFIVDGTYVATGNNSGSGIDFEYGILPVPKYNEEQANYMTNLRYPFNMYAVNKNASKEEKKIGAAIIEALASDSYRRVTPILFETTMKARYSKDDNSSKVYDILRDNVVFDLGRIHNYSINNYYPQFRTYCLNGGANWASNIAAIAKSMKKVLPNLTKIYAD